MLFAIALIASAMYFAALFWIAARTDKAERPFSPRTRGWIYGLSLAVYCTSWTFFGGVGTAANSGLQYLPIYLGPILLFTLGYGLIARILRQAKAQHSTSIADFLSARYGKSAAVAALVTVIAAVGALPYMALQLQSVGASLVALDSTRSLALDEVVFAVAAAMALFAILFGSRRADHAGENSGLVLTIAIEAVVKLFALLVLALVALVILVDIEAPSVSSVFNESQLDLRFGVLTLLAACAALCLPRQFHMTFVEAHDDRPTARKKWIFPAYLALTSLVIVPIVLAGLAVLPADTPRDSIVMALPLAMGSDGLALLMFIGGLSASTGMILIASVALSTMITNDLLAPVVFRSELSGQGDRTKLASRLLLLRRAVIAMLLALSYLVYRQFGETESLAGLGILAFAAAAQFAPGLVLGVLTRHGNRIGMLSGLAVGFGLWLILLAIPSATGAPAPMQVHEDALVSGVIMSLGANALVYWLASGLFVPSLLDAAQAAAFVGTAPAGNAMAYTTQKRVADIRLLLAQVVGRERALAAIAAMPENYRDSDPADEPVMAMAERTIAGVVGSSSSRLLVGSWAGGEPVPLADVVAMFDETSKRLTFSADLLQLAIDNIDQGVSVVDADMNLVAWNSRYCAMFGLPEDMVAVGTPIAELIRWNLLRGRGEYADIEEQVERRLEHMRAGRQHRMEREQADGTIMRIVGNPAPGGGYVTSYLDITADRRAEQALEDKVAERTQQLSAANAALEHATRSKTRFLAAASHDLIQPLNAARLFASALDEEFKSGDPGRQLVRDLDGSISSADRLIRALLDISKLDGGGIEAKLEQVPLNDLLEETVRQFEGQAEAKGLRMAYVPTRAIIETDRALMASVLRNLVSNAVRYTQEGGVLIGVRRSNGGIKLGVYDTGRGIAESDVKLIFDEFQRGPSTDSEGLGLGLAIVRRITALLDVHVETHSVEGRGSHFSLYLDNVEWGQQRRSERRTSQRGTQLRQASVLVVDNDKKARDAARALLERWHLDVADAADLATAKTASPRPPDIVLMDYQLDNDARGDSVFEALCAYWGERPAVILHTAEASEVTEMAAQAMGAHRLLKPAAPATLRALLASLLSQPERDNAQADQELAEG